MKFSSSDFKLMRLSIISICSSILASGIVLYGSQSFSDHVQKDFHTARNQMNDARNRLNAARLDQEYLAAFSRDYDSLESRNIIGDEHRLDWMEGLDRLRRQNLVIDFNYSIAPQQTYIPILPVDSGNLIINHSEMKLQFDLLHEGQLLRFLDSLRKQIKGQYQLDGCVMQRVSTQSANSVDTDTAPVLSTNIKAVCNGGWITLKNRNAPQ